jgi:uncharacterized protein
MLLIGVCFSMLVGMVLGMFLKKLIPSLTPSDERFYSFVVSSVCLQGMSLVLITIFLRQHDVTWSEFLGLPRPDWLRVVGAGLLMVLVITPIALGLNYVSKMLIEYYQSEATLQPTVQVLQIADTIPRKIYFCLTAVLGAPVVEESLFRGVAYRALRNRGHPWLALALSSILFGAIHLSAMSFVPLTVFGVAMALLYERTGSLLAPMITHSLFNLVNLTIFLLSSP